MTIYNTFKTKKKDTEKESLNDIVKGTKSVLANKYKFNEYIQNYSKTTERYTFKSPGISDYPLFKKKSCMLIPVKRTKINFYEDKTKDKAIKSKNIIIISPNESLYRKKLLFNINHIDISKKLLKNKLYRLYLNKNIHEMERYNSLFLDFFHKWTKDQINPHFLENSKINFSSRDYIDCDNSKNNNNNIKDIKNEKFSDLKYDDNKIFNEDYNKFIKEKIEYIKNNSIENTQQKIESVFNDSNGKEIELKLESVKIIFKPVTKDKIKKIRSHNITNQKDDENENNIVIYIPLYYAFLICYKKFELFKKILISSINFSNDFETISFNDKLISSALREYTSHNVIETPKMNQKKEYAYDSKKNVKFQTMNITPKKNLPFRKLATKNYINFNSTFGDKKPNMGSTFSMLRTSFLEKNEKIKKEEIIHLNKNRFRNSFYNTHYLSDKNTTPNNNQLHNKGTISNNYNEYIFLWETNSKTFIVTAQMPTIYFKYKSLRSEIVAFCDKNLFLYIYKNNFINWDFYVLNFLFSIKVFRKIILNNYSLNKKFNYNEIYSKTLDNERINLKKKKKLKENKLTIDIKDVKRFDILNESIIINKNKNKIYNILNEKNESYLFFYTDNNYTNSIVKMYSYLIVIDYEKLNPKIKWKYYLDFKQMNQLNEITKYESLETFLPKIIKTDFQNGLLSMDFSLFNEFNIEVLGYEKKNIIMKQSRNKPIGQTNTINNIPQSKELCIDIQYPYIEVIKAVKNNNNIIFNTNKVDLDINFLQKINNYKIDSWSQKILKIIGNSEEILNTSNSSNLSPKNSSKMMNKNKNLKLMPLSNSFNAKNLNFSRKFMKSVSFNSIPLTSKFH